MCHGDKTGCLSNRLGMKEQNIPKYYETDCSTEAGRTKVNTELSISLRVPMEEEGSINDVFMWLHVRNLWEA